MTIWWADNNINELWDKVNDKCSTFVDVESELSDVVSEEAEAIFDLIVGLLKEAGGEEYPGSIVEQSGGGATSALTLLYAAKPKTVFNRAVKLLAKRLKAIRKNP